MVFRRQHLLILGTEVLGEAHKAEIQAVGHRGSWEAERIMGGTGGLGETQGDWGRHRRLRSRLRVQDIVGGSEDRGRHRGSWEAQGDWGRHRRLRARLWGTGDYGGHQGSWEAHIAEFRAGGTRDPGRYRGPSAH